MPSESIDDLAGMDRVRLLLGTGWGVMILLICLLVGGAGHGSFLLLTFVAAPFSFVPPLAWAVGFPGAAFLGWLAPESEFRYVAGFHYMSGIVLVSNSDEWTRLRDLPAEYSYLSAAGFAVYVLGHALLWRIHLGAQKASRQQPGGLYLR